MTKVNSLSFTGYPEVTLLEQTGRDITTCFYFYFYLPELQEFLNYLPAIEYPPRERKVQTRCTIEFMERMQMRRLNEKGMILIELLCCYYYFRHPCNDCSPRI
ncbi:hypothetical protein KHA80_17085 [Anaerobacillus sp. HL2]|nr:hypothetical protein KHA80_17085 [Anaerobacillus sp. HL2]